MSPGIVVRDQMNLIIEHSAWSARTGRSSAILSAAMEIGCPVIALNSGHASHLEALVRGSQIKTINQPSFRGVSSFLLDHLTYERLFYDAARAINILIEENKTLRRELSHHGISPRGL